MRTRINSMKKQPFSFLQFIYTFARIAAAGSGAIIATWALGCGNDSSRPFADAGPNEAVRLAFVSSPTDSAPNLALAPAVQVALQDANDATVGTATAPIAISLNAMSSGGVLSGARTVVAAGGLASFTDLAIDTQGTYTLTASSPGMRPVTSTPFTINAHGWFTASNGLSSGSAGTFAIDPRATNNVYYSDWPFFAVANTTPSGVFKSTTAGQSWSPSSPGLPDTARIMGIDSGSSTIYAIDADKRAWQSRDGAASWEPFLIDPGDVRLSYLAVDGKTSGSIWIIRASDGGLYHSIDGGLNWVLVNAKSNCYDVHVDPSESQNLFCDVTLRSTDGGKSFQDIRGGLPAIPPAGSVSYWAFHLDAAGNAYTFAESTAETQWHLCKLTKGEISWATLGAGLPSGNAKGLDFFDLKSAPSNASIVYVVAAGNSGIYKSLDGGATFTAVGGKDLGIDSLTVDPRDPDVIYAGGEWVGPFKSTNGGVTWTKIATGLSIARATHLAVGAGTAPTLYTSVERQGVYESTDAGKSWNLLYDAPNDDINALATDPLHPGKVWIGSGGKLHAWTTGQLQWTPSDGSPDARAIVSDGTNLWVADASSKIWKSTDGGVHWPPDGTVAPGNATALAVDATNPTHLYAATTKGFARSMDGGASWSVVGPCGQTTIGEQPLIALAGDGSHVYVAGSNGNVFASADGGETCTGYGLGVTDDVTGLAIDSRDPSIVFASTASSGLYRSIDGGKAWTSSKVGLLGSHFGGIVAAPTLGAHTFFAASSKYGVFETTSDGQ